VDLVWRTFVVDDELGLAGVAALERHSDGGGPVFLLRSVAVRPDRRGTGLGDQLVRAALDAADTDAVGTATVALLTETAVGYFDRLGFRAVARSELPPALDASPEFAGACPDTATAYLRP
jgi:amino-acid N-acetyltransferase